ncbi:MAG: bifunctional ornithine acetyltransferase/N-acetylglutamate synthase [Vallitaleaceae bacterium]|jgi:glutamate N-acetyltransferase/amino-acid N-acetyltransferase|nr:bifunctional ornithine acetyltransferase/N-acetylglutamate synthase [Vallitaleaceae bacterium]
MKEIQGGITAPIGFSATGAHIGIKKAKKDLALIQSNTKAVYAGAFTKNVVKAACVKWNMERFDNRDYIRAIVINSGNANACTGAQGLKDNESMAQTVAEGLNCDKEAVLVASTGVIGVPMPIETIITGITKTIPNLGFGMDDGRLAAEAIMTTDTFVKEVAVSIEVAGKAVTIGGISKGSGMIHPNMATMLSFVTTDADIEHDLLQEIVADIVDDTYNMISVDGDTSTNDMVTILANGLSGIVIDDKETKAYQDFYQALRYVNTYLAQQIIHDGEGVTKVLEVRISGAKDKNDAKLMGKSIITSNLFKTAMFGSDANWGRILCAMGYSGAEFDHEKVSVTYISDKGEVPVLGEGVPIPFDEDHARHVLSEKEIIVEVMLKEGEGHAVAWGCDLSYEYVKINGEYRS